MSHVAQEVLLIHAGMPNEIPFGPLKGNDGQVLEGIDPPEVTIYHRTTGVPDPEVDPLVAGETWPFPTESQENNTWLAPLGVLDVKEGQQLWVTLRFTDPADNEITIPYRARVVPPVPV